MHSWVPNLLATVLVASCFLAPSARAEVIVFEVAQSSGLEKDFRLAKASALDATQALENGDTTSALAHAESAYRAYPNASTASIMASIYASGDNHRRAFEWFLRAMNHKPAEAFLAKVKAGLAEHGAKKRLGVFRAQVEPSEAVVTLSGTAIPAGAFVGVSYGDHTLAVRKEGFEPGTQTVSIASSGVVTANVSLTPRPKVVAPVESNGLSAAPLALVIGGVVAVGAGAGLHIWGLGRDSDLADDNGRWASQGLDATAARAEFDAAQSDAELGTTLAFVLYGVGGAALVTGAILWALDTPPTEAGSAEVVLAPRYLPGGGGLVLTGGF